MGWRVPLRWVMRKLTGYIGRLAGCGRSERKPKLTGTLNGSVPLPPYPQAIFPDPVDGRSERENVNDVLLGCKEGLVGGEVNSWLASESRFSLKKLGVAVSRSSFYRFLHRQGLYDMGQGESPCGARVIVHRPGESLLLDLGKAAGTWSDPQSGKRVTLWASPWDFRFQPLHDGETGLDQRYPDDAGC